jgi:MoaA/NifB/PqqE/SkfB family radical SAM enzyme
MKEDRRDEEELVKRIIRWFQGKPQPPFSLELWPSLRCNLRCKFCTSWKVKKESLSEEDLLEIIKEAHRIGVRECFLSGGGEPFMRKEIVLQIMEEIKKYGMWGCIMTNGTLLSRPDLEFLVEIGWNEIFFSLDGPAAELHDYHRGVKGTYKKVMRVVSELNKLKKEKNSYLPFIYFNTVLTKKNFLNLEEFIKLAKSMNCNLITFQSLMESASETKNLKIKNLRIFREKVKKAIKLAKAINMATNLENFLNLEYIKYSDKVGEFFLKDVEGKKGIFSIPCYDPWYVIVVTQRGKVGPCAVWAERNSKNSSLSLKKAWYGDYFNLIREKMIKHEMEGCLCCTHKIINTRRWREKIAKLLG